MRFALFFFSFFIGVLVTSSAIGSVRTQSFEPLIVCVGCIACGVGWGVFYFGGRR
jgi:hypothetical protein